MVPSPGSKVLYTHAEPGRADRVRKRDEVEINLYARSGAHTSDQSRCGFVRVTTFSYSVVTYVNVPLVDADTTAGESLAPRQARKTYQVVEWVALCAICAPAYLAGRQLFGLRHLRVDYRSHTSG